MNEARIIGLSYHLAVSSGDFFVLSLKSLDTLNSWCIPLVVLCPTCLAQSNAPIKGWSTFFFLPEKSVVNNSAGGDDHEGINHHQQNNNWMAWAHSGSHIHPQLGLSPHPTALNLPELQLHLWFVWSQKRDLCSRQHRLLEYAGKGWGILQMFFFLIIRENKN